MKDQQQKSDSVFFISDLHLSPKYPQITDRFKAFIENKARHARALYILGDLFEYWLGDDATDALAEEVAVSLSQLAQGNTQIYYMHGNRDFLIGEEFAQRCQFEILPDPIIHTIFDRSWILTHGDALCTDDQAYQAVRRIVREPSWQQDFLLKSISERIAFAEEARKKSSQHTQTANDDIMDVNQQAVSNLFDEHAQTLCIHGHTHRPAVHRHDNNTRVVLGDWHNSSSYVLMKPNGYQLIHGAMDEQ
ncbi:UDP-2,3-diacylglucosamine diphosphatase [Marinicella sp. W31]|uniref:UDP-2,3-diacylglucosamine diphosphatase n=1 Tax=Marinicella sp. W31 TaxID=3023713 RepID=UPI003757E0CD